MRRHFRGFVLFIFVLAASVIVGAQVRVDVRLVNVVATVTDDRGRYVDALTAEDFIVEEDNKLQKISHFSQDEAVPASVGVVVDTSGSMERKIRTAVDAVDRFIRRIHDDDEIFIMTFSSEPVLRQDFTGDRNKLSQAMRKIWVTGGTALFDALEEALDKIRYGRHDKRALLVITDGQDTSSLTKLDQVLQTIRRSELLVYSIGISPRTYAPRADHVPFGWPPVLTGKPSVASKRDEVDMNVLRAFAENSGGRSFLLSESFLGGRGTEIEKVLDSVADELRSQYTLGYYPERPDDGRYHTIRIRTKRGLAVRARRGYLAGGS